MGTTVSLSDADLAVEPGSTVSTTLRVRNTGDVVDQITFQPLGDAASWITVEPAEVRLFPNTDESVAVRICPPRESSSHPGPTDWAVRALPREDPDGSAVAEGTVDVGMYAEVAAEMQPEIGHGRLRGRFELAIDNRGNIPVPVRATGTDAEQSLEFDFSEPILDCEPGTARFTKIKVKPAKRIWKGQPKTHAFEILAEPQVIEMADLEPPHQDTPGELPAPGGGGTALLEAPALAPAPSMPTVAPMTLTGTYVQVPILPKWFWKAVLALLVLAVVLWILWHTLFKPTIESAAREVALEETAALAEEVAAVDEKVDEATAAGEAQAAAAAEDIADLAEQAAGTTGGALDSTFNETTKPSNFRIAVSAAPGAVATTSAAALPTNATFALTDVILQNPRGDFGIISVQIGGVPIIESSLDNFRDLDFHFVAPYVADSSAPLSVVVECAAVQIPADGGCSPAVSFSGFETVVTPAED